jgi:hypothetical protein
LHFREALELLRANGQEGQAGGATEPLQRFGVFVGGDGALAERDAPGGQEVAA